MAVSTVLILHLSQTGKNPWFWLLAIMVPAKQRSWSPYVWRSTANAPSARVLGRPNMSGISLEGSTTSPRTAEPQLNWPSRANTSAMRTSTPCGDLGRPAVPASLKALSLNAMAHRWRISQARIGTTILKTSFQLGCRSFSFSMARRSKILLTIRKALG